MTEIKPGDGKITAERPVAGKEGAAAALRHFDGADNLQGQALQGKMQEYSRANPETDIAPA
jgi:hypothetical protein